MTTIYQYIIKDNNTGYPEVFRTVRKGYIPEGYTLETELSSFTIGGELSYGQQEKPRKKSFWERLLGNAKQGSK